MFGGISQVERVLAADLDRRKITPTKPLLAIFLPERAWKAEEPGVVFNQAEPEFFKVWQKVFGFD